MIIPANWNLPEAIKQRLSPTTYGRQRAILENGQLVLVLHKPPKHDDTTREGVLFWRNAAGEWQVSRGGGPGGLKRHVQDYAQLEAKLTEQYEAAHDTQSLFSLLETVSPLARAAHNMHQALQAAREGIDNDPFLLEMRDAASDIDRNFELLLEEVRNALHYRTAREAEEQARLTREALHASHRLNIIAALFLPVTAITSAFGMNLPHSFGNGGTSTFWLVLALGVGLGVAIMAWVLSNPPTKADSVKSKPKRSP